LRSKIFTVGLMVMVLALLPMMAIGQTESQSESVVTIREIITLAVGNSPILQLQQAHVDEIKQMPQPGEGFIDFDVLESQLTGPDAPQLGLAQISQLESWRVIRLSRKQALLSAKISYENQKKSLIAELMGKIASISALTNKLQVQAQLESFLEERKVSLEKQVRAGLVARADLFDLAERIMNVSMDMEDATVELNTTRLETALVFGGEKWEELLTLLYEL